MKKISGVAYKKAKQQHIDQRKKAIIARRRQQRKTAWRRIAARLMAAWRGGGENQRRGGACGVGGNGNGESTKHPAMVVAVSAAAIMKCEYGKSMAKNAAWHHRKAARS